MQYRLNNPQMPPMVMNLLIINVLMFLATTITPSSIQNSLLDALALHYFASPDFRFWQPVTYMFLHANFSHLFFNMFALWMFGRSLEHEMGPKRFLTFYLITGVGAGLLQLGVCYLELLNAKAQLLQAGIDAGASLEISRLINGITVGASGAVFGVLLAFGMFYPNSIIMLLFPPIPLKAKYFVIIYGLIELFAGISNTSPGVAHFAHVGGMLWGYLLLRLWKKQGKIYY